MKGRNKKIRIADFGCNPFEGYFIFGLAEMMSLLLHFVSFSQYEVEMMSFIARLEVCDL